MTDGMMWGMGFYWVLIVVILLLAGAALVKLLILPRTKQHTQ